MSSNQRFVLILVGMLLVGIALMKASPAQQTDATRQSASASVQTKSLEIVDEKGRICAVFSASRGEPNIYFINPDDKVGPETMTLEPHRLIFWSNIHSHNEKAGAITLNGTGSSRVMLGVNNTSTKEGDAYLSLDGVSDKRGISLNTESVAASLDTNHLERGDTFRVITPEDCKTYKGK